VREEPRAQGACIQGEHQAAIPRCTAAHREREIE
jgi:hypothetical protein